MSKPRLIVPRGSRVQGSKAFQSSRPWGSVEPDKRYDIGDVDVRFDVPFGISWEAMQVYAAPTVQKAIDQFEKIGKWQYYPKIPIQYRISTVHSAQLDRMTNLKLGPELWENRNWVGAAVNEIESDVVSMVAKVFFIRPLIWINQDEEAEYKKSLGYANGFVPKEDMPEEWINRGSSDTAGE